MALLVPMSEAQFTDYTQESIPAFARDKIESGQWPESEALERSRKSFAELLPNGLATPDNFFYAVQHGLGQEIVCMIWIAVQSRGGNKIAYVYDVVVWQQHRRKGYATLALAALEEEVRALGLSGIALHVFGHNTAAHSLYVKLGYQPTNINMFKALTNA